MEVPVYNLQGEVLENIKLSDYVFGIEFNSAVVHQAMVRQLANKRQGTAKTKTRGEVRGSTKKLYRQKGTGRARRGDRRSPLLRGGGVTFGPVPHSHHQAMPKKMRRLAIRCLLSDKVNNKFLIVVDKFDLPSHKTKELEKTLVGLGVNSKALVATLETNVNLVKASNLLHGIQRNYIIIQPNSLLAIGRIRNNSDKRLFSV